MSVTPKDHKELPSSGIPKSRPLGDGSSTINGRLNDMLSDILVSLIEADGQTAEVISTEDLLSRVEEFNELIRTGQVDGEGLTLGSLDVEAL